MEEVDMRIGELAERTGVSRRSLRYYEQRGLLYAHRSEKGWREYDEAAVTRVANVRDLLAAGLRIEDIHRYRRRACSKTLIRRRPVMRPLRCTPNGWPKSTRRWPRCEATATSSPRGSTIWWSAGARS